MDYYKILGVEKDSSEDDIKKAYRKLAKQYHPDINPTDAAAEAKFKQINAAYEVLGDKNKRAAYNNTNQQSQGQYKPYSRGYTNDRFNDMFADIFTKHEYDQFFGRRQRQHFNENYTVNVNVTLEEVFSGVEKDLTLKLPTGEIKKVKVDVPRGICNNYKITLKQQGGKSNTELPPGNIEVICKITKHSVFSSNGRDLAMTLELSVFDLVLGCEKELVTIDSSKINLKVPAGINSGQVIRVANKGMPELHGYKSGRGDLFVTIVGKTPKIVDEADVTALAELRVKYS